MNTLIEIIDEDETLCTALEYDLISLGLRLRWLGTEVLTWRDLKVIVLHSDRHSAMFRAKHPDDEAWGISEHLLARSVEALEKLWWAKTTDAKYRRNRPEPIYRPGVEKPEQEKPIGDKAQVLDIESMDEWLGWSPMDKAVN